jgi:glucose/arabinose dehydrogenase
LTNPGTVVGRAELNHLHSEELEPMTIDWNGQLERVATGWCFPTSLTFDDDGTLYLAEAGLPFGGARPGGRIWRLTPDGRRSLLAADLRPPVNGLTFHDGALYVSEGGHPGRISRFERDRGQTVLLDHLPGPGNYHVNMVAFGPDGKLYFSQGAMTNTGIVGLDAYELGWLRRLPHAHDLPGQDIVLTGVNVETEDPLTDTPREPTQTGAFVPFGTRTRPGQRIAAQLPCTASIMRCDPNGSNLELVAWGLRNAYALGFLPDGRFLAIDQGADDRGSRPVGNAPDLLFEVRQGSWYGWPDFIGAEPITDSRFIPERGPAPSFVLANHDALPPPERPLLRFDPHVGAVKFSVVPGKADVQADSLIVALFGDERPITAPPGPRAGRAVARVDLRSWTVHAIIGEPLVRPIDVGFHPSTGELYVLDFGSFEVDARRGVIADPESGVLWRFCHPICL